MPDLTGRIAVLGIGRSGTAVVQWALARPGTTPADVAVFVEHDTPALRDETEMLRRAGVEVVLGAETVPDEGFSLVVASPGIAPSRPIMTSAQHLGLPVISELELAYLVAEASFVAITGTNGKTTVTSLVAHLLGVAGREAASAGNIGSPALDAARVLPANATIVAECSSFQLALTHTFHPRVAVLLNITPDHIDWHGSIEEYASDKARIFANLQAGDVAIIDVDDPGAAAWVESVRGSGARVVTVGVSGHADARLEGDVLVVRQEDEVVRLVRTDELRIRGSHNVSNALAASAAALAAGADPQAIREGLRSFMPIEHRLEPVGVVGGVAFVNDSKATNPDAVLKALTAFEGEPLIVLLGGRNKGNSFDELAAACGEACKLAVLYGESRPELEESFARVAAPFALSTDLLSALDLARRHAVEGDTVLLSPACASFDEFTGYEERGRVFTAAVRAWAGERA